MVVVVLKTSCLLHIRFIILVVQGEGERGQLTVKPSLISYLSDFVSSVDLDELSVAATGVGYKTRTSATTVYKLVISQL